VGTLVDTSVLIGVERGARALELDEEHAIAAITAAELLHGVHRASAAERARREAFVEGLLAEVPTIPFTLAIARVHARLWAELAMAGRVPGAHDLMVAATAVALDWPLLTLDRRGFARMRGLRLASAS
jgi:tRNA(fMet)-specific endonuclease VapC